MIDATVKKSPGGPGSERTWTSSLPQVTGEDIIDIGHGRFAHFRRRGLAQVQVMFTAPAGVDPDPGPELTGQFKEQGWTCAEEKPGKPWVFQLDEPSEDDPFAHEDSRAVLHEQFLIIINEYRQHHELAPTSGWQTLFTSDVELQNSERGGFSSTFLADQSYTSGEEQKPKAEKQGTRAGGGAAGPAEMLDAFASVGAERVDLTLTDAGGKKVEFRGNRTLRQLRTAMPAIVQEAAEQQHNVIVRPRSARATLIQLDDLGEDAAARLRPVSFLVLRTSPGSYQAWVAVADGDAEFAKRLRRGAGADLTASGATRISGSLNFKEKYAPDFPCVETVHCSPGQVVTRAELEALGVVAPAEKRGEAAIDTARRRPDPRGWPSYQRCIDDAPEARGGGRPDRSRADFTFCLFAIKWGWSVEQTVARLMLESSKAQEKGEAYAMLTAQNAAAAVGRGGRRGR
jgi:hypothetical protein